MTHESGSIDAPPSLGALFSAFVTIGVFGFGGVAALARHVLVVDRRLMSERDFAESFGVASTLPGANTVNLAAMLGDRWRGPLGACAAVAGLMGPPLLILVGLMALYARFSTQADVRAGLAGAAAAAAGLVLGTSLRLFLALAPNLAKLVVFLGVCGAAALLQAPMLLILAVAIPVSLGFAFSERHRQ